MPRMLPLLSLLALAACGEAPAPAPEAAPAAPAPQPEAAPAPMEAAPAGSKISFTEPADGATVTSPVKVVMAVEGLAVNPAGEIKSGTGHHHLIVDGQGLALGEIVPKDATHIHFGDGRAESTVELTPGSHTLTLQFADGMHRSYGPELSATITVTVSGEAAPAEQAAPAAPK